MPRAPRTPPSDTLWSPIPADRVLALFRDRLLLPADQLKALGEGAYNLAWSVAGVTQVRVLERLSDALSEILTEGGTTADWLDSLDQILEDTGWGTTQAHAETILRTTLASVYEADRYEQLMADPYTEILVFDAINDDRVRPEHLALDGMAWRKEEFPPEYWTPLDFGCRCSVIPADADELKDLGAKLQDGGDLIRGEDGEVIRAAEGFRTAPSVSGLTEQQRQELQDRLAALGWGVEPPVALPSPNAIVDPLVDEAIRVTGTPERGGVNESLVGETAESKMPVFIKPNRYLDGAPRLRATIRPEEQPANELAAGVVNEFLGRLVTMPRVVLREVEGVGESVVMEFVEDAMTFGRSQAARKAFSAWETGSEAVEQTRHLALFDALIGNTDRHVGNAMWTARGLVAIDHGYAFGLGPDNLWSFAVEYLERHGEAGLTPGERSTLKGLLDRRDELRATLTRHLSQERIDAILERAKTMLRRGRLLKHGASL